MINAKLFVCSDSASLDMRTNLISIFGVLEQVSAATFPIALPRICIVGVFTREQADPANINLQLQLLLNDDQSLYNGPLNINFAHQLTARSIGEMRNLAIPSPGTLIVRIAERERIISSWSLNFIQVGMPEMRPS